MICCSSALCARDAASSIASGNVANAAAAPPHYFCQVTALSWTAGTVLGRTHARSWTCSAAAQTNLSKSTATRTISDVDECQRRSAPARPQAIGGSMPACYEPDGSQPARPAPLQLRCTEQPSTSQQAGRAFQTADTALFLHSGTLSYMPLPAAEAATGVQNCCTRRRKQQARGEGSARGKNIERKCSSWELKTAGVENSGTQGKG